MSTSNQSRGYGIVVTFHPAFEQRIRILASHPLMHYPPQGDPELRRPEFIVEKPHLTLFHGRLQAGFDPETVRDQVRDIDRLYAGEIVSFGDVKVFGDKFLFLDANLTPSLMAAHAMAVVSFLPFLDREAEPAAAKEALNLTQDEMASVRTFGHPLCGKLARPHITLGYYPDARELERHPTTLSIPIVAQVATIRSVVLAEIGEYGAVTRILF